MSAFPQPNPREIPKLTVKEILTSVEELPTIPASALRVARMTESSNAGAAEIADAISHDQGLSARVLRLSNGAYYGMQRKVSSLREAVVVLGLHTVRQLAIVSGIVPWIRPKLDIYQISKKDYLHQSMGIAAGAKMTARATHKNFHEEAFAAGLLCDIGMAAMNEVLPPWVYPRIQELLEAGYDLSSTEKELFGLDHAQVGAELAKTWNLPDSIVEALRGHHGAPVDADYIEIAACLGIAQYLTQVSGFGTPCEIPDEELLHRSMRVLGMNTHDLEELLEVFGDACSQQIAWLEESGLF